MTGAKVMDDMVSGVIAVLLGVLLFSFARFGRGACNDRALIAALSFCGGSMMASGLIRIFDLLNN